MAKKKFKQGEVITRINELKETSNKRWIKKMSEELFNYFKEPEDNNLRCCKCGCILKEKDNKYIICSLEQKNLVSKFLCEKCYKKDKEGKQ